MLVIHSDQVIVTEDTRGSFGAIVVSEQASAAGAASVPAPSIEPDGEWYVHEGWTHRFQFDSASGFESSAGTRIQVDSKAMRKVESNKDIVFVGENQAAAALGVQMTGSGRMLIKLH